MQTNSALVETIKDCIQEIRPMIQSDGGDITFVAFEEGVVKVELQGACVGCPMSLYTLKLGIEGRLKERVPEVLEVVALNQ